MVKNASEARFRRFLVRLDAAEASDDVWSAAMDLAQAEGFARLSYLHHDPAAPELSGLSFARGFDPDWIAAYRDEDLVQVDPVPWTAMGESDPFRWSRAGALRQMSQSEIAFMDRFRAAGGGEGLAIQAFGPRRRMGYIGLGHDGADPFGEAEGRHAPERLRLLQAACQVAHLRVCGLLDASARPLPALSVREREVLTWMARGKSNPAIAGILGCSAHTVDTHVRRLFAKLDVGDRISCVVRATAVGLVSA
ncbi:LuxR family transcriptional regulator [uncultured Albimonas sp.]|uniref:LuxR family transcriptional regulator n=1 Tax=uncultured Albimonas sp. TaxID=1331701 RepID=UPI0030ED64AB